MAYVWNIKDPYSFSFPSISLSLLFCLTSDTIFFQVDYPSELQAFFQIMIVAFFFFQNIFCRVINRLLTKLAGDSTGRCWPSGFLSTRLVIPYWSAYLIEHLKDFLRQIVTASYYKEYWYSGMNPAILEAQSNQWLSSLQKNSKTRWPASLLINLSRTLIFQQCPMYEYHILNIAGRFHIIYFLV